MVGELVGWLASEILPCLLKRTSVSLAVFKSVFNGDVGGMVQTRLILPLTSWIQASPCDMLPFGQNWEPL